MIGESEEVVAAHNGQMRKALESVLAWAEAEGFESPSLKAARELLEEISTAAS